MTDDPTPPIRVPDEATGDRVTCPVCGIEGDEGGLRDHLVYEHGLTDERSPVE